MREPFFSVLWELDLAYAETARPGARARRRLVTAERVAAA
jgi:hypothetical protein